MVNSNGAGQKKKWTKVGTVRKSEKGGHYIKLEKDTVLLVNGKPVAATSLTIQNPVESRTRLLNSGKAKDNAKLENEIEQFKAGGKLDFIVDELYITE